MSLDLARNLTRLRERIAAAAERAGRDPRAITLVAVTKAHPPQAVVALHGLGLRDFGESRAQEAAPKFQLDLEGVRWHWIGRLQENKINKILPHVTLLHSIDGEALAHAVSTRAERAGRRLDVLLQVNTSGEATKQGVSPQEVVRLWSRLTRLAGLRLRGLMTIAPWTPDPARVRASFRTLRTLGQRVRDTTPDADILSMGMTDDLELAIEEGSTLVRVGRGLLGPRPQ